MDLGLQGPRLHRHRRRARARPGHRRRRWSPRAPGWCSPAGTPEPLDAGRRRARRHARDRRRGATTPTPGRRRRWSTPPGRRAGGSTGPWSPSAAHRSRHRHGHPRRGVDRGRSSRSSSARSALGPRGRPRELGGRRLDRVRAVHLGASRRSPDLAISNGLRPGWRWSPRRWPTSSGRAASGSTGCCPGGSAPSGSPSWTSRPATPRRPGRRRSQAIPLRPLRRAGGVRPGRGVPALARPRPSSPASMLPVDGGHAARRSEAPCRDVLALAHRRRVAAAACARRRRGSRSRRPRATPKNHHCSP